MKKGRPAFFFNNTSKFRHLTLSLDVHRTEGQFLYQNPKFNFEKSVEYPRSSLRTTVEEKGTV
jgi:hypothetical protein